jgi:general stress protein YciG
MAEKREKSSGGGMTVREAGRRGGAKVAAERGSKFYSEIGRKGGEAVSQNREHMANIGRKGGERRGKASRETEAVPPEGTESGEATASREADEDTEETSGLTEGDESRPTS